MMSQYVPQIQAFYLLGGIRLRGITLPLVGAESSSPKKYFPDGNWQHIRMAAVLGGSYRSARVLLAPRPTKPMTSRAKQLGSGTAAGTARVVD